MVTPLSDTGTAPAYASPWLKSSLDPRLNVLQRISHSTAQSSDQTTIDERIKSERLAQLQHANIRAAEDAALRAGIYVRADECEAAVRRYRRAADDLLRSASFMPIANAIVAAHAQTPQDVLRAMRTTWREVRAEAAKAQGAGALVIPILVDGDADAAG